MPPIMVKDLTEADRQEGARLLAEFRTVVENAAPYVPAPHDLPFGVVIAGGGEKYFPCVWVCLKAVRQVNPNVPIEVWYLGKEEMDEHMLALVRSFDATPVDALEVAKQDPMRKLGGWELKIFAMQHAHFQQVLFLDADNMPLRDPFFLLQEPEYQRTGAIFWPDYLRLAPTRAIWSLLQVPYQDEPEFESGQMLMNKAQVWREMQAARFLNEHSDFYYRFFHGDKETFHLAWRFCNTPYTMPDRPIENLANMVMCQHDLQGNRLFQHRNLRKWGLTYNARITGFVLEAECLGWIQELRQLWTGKITPTGPRQVDELRRTIHQQRLFRYHRVGYDLRTMELLPDGKIGVGRAGMEQRWGLEDIGGHPHLCLFGSSGRTCELTLRGTVWEGRWLLFEKMPITLTPVPASQ